MYPNIAPKILTLIKELSNFFSPNKKTKYYSIVVFCSFEEEGNVT